ncbi:(deoxy)nucleoside triphosphate pyrophosphohydrolase [Mycetocola reblochoni]|uniref:8-oxo-dGTP diphosphatase n=2 Tax=Mycetocola reblochoni TaxID=331618 RepID=A0A1R4KBT6_9MICO|nr:(deoxy)nucleoside triphosphate pyrophosphohydrolase [Mycetocola reblochoni]RLP68561.1 (deoxy)nucleoside triphosphate pyrophosphohydrolase [Mycetocola reblochoni]SJN41780.1 Mutator mutT protein (7,8-dihydro-8-oxoguanine-triphosphatase) [Mycetocola reblochoni REB411]
MPTTPIAVVGAAIVRADGAVLCAERGHGPFSGLWEFPGGKVEQGETPEQALVREITEELRCTVEVGRALTSTPHDGGARPIVLTTYLCRLSEGEPSPTEHGQLRWLAPAELHTLDWAPADRPAARLLAAG